MVPALAGLVLVQVLYGVQEVDPVARAPLAHSTRSSPGSPALIFVRNTRSPIFGVISSPVSSSATSARASDSISFPVRVSFRLPPPLDERPQLLPHRIQSMTRGPASAARTSPSWPMRHRRIGAVAKKRRAKAPHARSQRPTLPGARCNSPPVSPRQTLVLGCSSRCWGSVVAGLPGSMA